MYDPAILYFANPVVGGNGTGSVEYLVLNGSDVAQLDPNNPGTLIINKAGEVTVQATKAGDEQYAEAQLCYTLVIKQSNKPTFSLSTDKMSMYYGVETLTLEEVYALVNPVDGIPSELAHYSIYVRANELGAYISEDGNLVFDAQAAQQTGVITLYVTKQADDRYLVYTQELELTIEYPAMPEYTIADSQGNPIAPDAEGWYNGDICIVPAEGWVISTENGRDASWQEKLLFTEESTGNDGVKPVFAFRNTADGSITAMNEIADYKMDKTAPAVDMVYDANLTWFEVVGQWFGIQKDTVSVTFQATDNGSGLDYIDYSIDGGKTVANRIYFNGQTTGTYTIELAAQYRDSVTFLTVDKVGNKTEYSDGKILVVDAITPALDVKYDCSVEHYEEGNTLYAKDMTILFEITADNFDLSNVPVFTVNGSDVTLTWTTDGMINSASYTFDANNDYVVSLSFTDRLGRAVSYEKNIHLDNVAPVITVAYNPINNGAYGLNYNQKTMQATITVTEHNFDAAKVASSITAAEINGVALSVAEIESIAAYLRDPSKWNSDGDVHTAIVEFSSDARYGLTLNCTDKAGNTGSYNANAFVMDHDAATALSVTYSDYIHLWSDVLNIITFGTYNAETELIVTVTAQDTVAGIHHFEYVFTQQGMAFSDKIFQIAYPSETPVKGDASIVSAEFNIPPEAKGYVSFRVVDNAGNVSEWFHDANAIKIVDITAPEALEISYSEAVKLWPGVLETITFGAYNAEKELIVTVTATDELAGIQYFEYVFTTEGAEFSEEGAMVVYPVELLDAGDISTASASFDIPPEARGYVSFRAVDMADNVSEWFHDVNVINIVDTIAPEFAIEYVAEHNSYDLDADEIIDGLYFKGDAEIKLNITEANFYSEDVKVTVSKDGGEAEVIPAETIQWNLVNAETMQYAAVITLSGEGDYVLSVEYTDRSANAMETFVSDRIVIDTTAPSVGITYGLGEELGKVVNDRTYFTAAQTATVTIVEKNFRPDEVVLSITAEDLLGNAIMVEEAKLSDILSGSANKMENWSAYEANWRREDNTYVLQLTFNTEANYTVDIDYVDLAGNASADYAADLFTVDMTAPVNTETILYSSPIFTQIQGENIQGYYYNEHMTVTVSATDMISPIDQIIYSYITAKGVSDVNQGLLDQIMEGAQLTKDGYTVTATFSIPKEVILQAGNQFNGTVAFHATDRAGNNSEPTTDTKFVVVDNIEPTSRISYNEPAQTIDGVAYYAGNINATIVINEANFFSEDVEVTVSTNGGDFRPVKVRWYNNSADKHTGTFSLAAEGQYVVKVNYQDRSTNEMNSYTSGKMIVDTTAPKIEVSQISHGTANNAETIGFTLTVTDNNILTKNILPVLQAVVRKGDAFETVTIDLAEAKYEGNGVYTVTVENLAEDGFYTFTCTATDNALNTSSDILYGEAGDQSVEKMNFSVNRAGSTFVIENSDLNGKYINGEVQLIVKEINVDKVGEGDKQTVFTLNNGSQSKEIVLNEENCKMNVQVGEGGWYETTYILDNSYFTEDGVYSINIISYDAANNSNVNTKSPEGTITFTVDRTKPVISANITSQQIINSAEHKVHFQLTEANLNGATVVAKFNGKEVAVEDLGNNEYSFTVGSGLNHQLEITATDLAGNEADIYVADPFTVSTNFFVRWYANTFWFWFSIIAAIVLAAVVIFIIILFKRKKKENG